VVIRSCNTKKYRQCSSQK